MAVKSALASSAHPEIKALEDILVTKTVSLHGPDAEAKRLEILEYFEKSFTLYESLFECLNGDEAFYARANTLRHPLIFYYGHTAVLFINKLNVAKLIDQRIDPKIESMLAIGVDEMSWDDLNEAHYDWPTPQEVKAYRDKTREIVRNFIKNCDASLPIGWDSPLWVVMLGIEHERIHLETSAVLIRELPLKYVRPHPVWGRICNQSGKAPENALLPVKGGPVVLGKGRDNPYYGWDNEYGRFETEIPDFKASKYLVSNGEYLEFVEAGGYEAREFWDEEGWSWATYKTARMPVYWRKAGGKHRYRAMLEEIDMPWDWPVDVNCLEARAFCRWKAKVTGKPIRLPTEPEWYKLRDILKTDQPEWAVAPGNINLEGDMSSCPVNRHAGPGGFFDIVGNAWQWTETLIDAYEGFEVHPVYDDFSTPTFDGQHNVFKGGCWISTGNYAIRDSRYAFRRHFFQCSGIRYVEAGPLPEPRFNPYETDAQIVRSIEFHYGPPIGGDENFAVACARRVLEAAKGGKSVKALDIGCGAGRMAFELARVFDHVDALDFSARLIQAPTNLQVKGIQRYMVPEEGEIMAFREVRIEELGYRDVKDKILFAQADACNLIGKYNGYDLVFSGRLIEHLYDPGKFLAEIGGRINSGGLLILTSTYDWQAGITPREKWPGGFKASTGENFTSLEGISQILAPQFERVREAEDISFALRRTARVCERGTAQMTVWRKKL